MEIPCLSGFNAFIIVIIISLIAGAFGIPPTVTGFINLAVVILWLYGFLRNDCVYNPYGQYVKKEAV